MAARDQLYAKVVETYKELVKEGEAVRDPEKAVKLLESRYKLVVDERVVSVVYAAFLNGRPVLFEGPPGTGKTEVGQALLELWSGRTPFVLPCSENYDEYRVIGDFHPLMAMRFGFNESSFVPRPLLAAIMLDTGVLIDEIRRASEEFQNLLLDIIDKRRVVVPELRRVIYSQGEGFQIIFTSNPEDIAQGELSDAFLRRVVRVEFRYPSKDVELRILRIRTVDNGPPIPHELEERMLAVVRRLRSDSVDYKPGVSDTVLWAQMAQKLAALRGRREVTVKDVLDSGLTVLTKRVTDAELVSKVLRESLL